VFELHRFVEEGYGGDSSRLNKLALVPVNKDGTNDKEGNAKADPYRRRTAQEISLFQSRLIFKPRVDKN
jgi:hypothetical protein